MASQAMLAGMKFSITGKPNSHVFRYLNEFFKDKLGQLHDFMFLDSINDIEFHYSIFNKYSGYLMLTYQVGNIIIL